MIVTLTPNPALDVTTSTDIVRTGEKIRCGEVSYYPGGGGVNVARVAHELGSSALAVFAAGGFTGRRIEMLMTEAGVPMKVVAVSGDTRESFTVDEAATGRQFRFVLPGPALTRSEQRALLDAFSSSLRPGTIAVASGSLPPGVHPDLYNEVARICSERGLRLIFDSSGVGLSGLESPAFLVKPSLRELSELVGRPLHQRDEQVEAARTLIESGLAETVVVSQAAHGALLVTEADDTWLPAVSVPRGSGVGSGDALVAGIAVGLERGWPTRDAVDYGMAAGAAMLLSPGTAVCRREDVDRLFTREHGDRTSRSPLHVPTAI